MYILGGNALKSTQNLVLGVHIKCVLFKRTIFVYVFILKIRKNQDGMVLGLSTSRTNTEQK